MSSDSAVSNKKERERARIAALKNAEHDRRVRAEQRHRDNLGKAVNTCQCLWFDVLGEPHDVSAIDAKWTSKLGFVTFLPSDNVEGNDDCLAMQAAALQKLLQVPYHVFWSHAFFDADARTFLDTYLRFATRPYDLSFQAYSGKDLRSQVFQRTLKVLARAAVPRESKEFFMEPEFHVKWLSSAASWFDIPRILDLCSLYLGNQKILQTVVSELFRAVPKLYDELKKAVTVLIKTLDKAFAQKGGNADDRDLFLMDSICSLFALCTVFPKALRHLQLQGMFTCLERCYEAWIPRVTVGGLQQRLRRLCVWLGYNLLEFNFFARVYEPGSNKYNETVAREMLELFQERLSGIPGATTPEFFQVLHRERDLAGALQKLLKSGVGLPPEDVATFVSRLERLGPALSDVNGISDAKSTTTAAAVVRTPPSVQKVLDVFPEMGTKFVEACLSEMDNNPETVINAILTNELPPAVAKLDRTTGEPPASVKQKAVVSGKGKEEAEDLQVTSAAPSQTKVSSNAKANPPPPAAAASAMEALESFVPAELDNCTMEEIQEERGNVLHRGKKGFDAAIRELEIDHDVREFVTRYANAYEDEADDSYAIHARLTMEPLAEDEEEGTVAEVEEQTDDHQSGESQQQQQQQPQSQQQQQRGRQRQQQIAPPSAGQQGAGGSSQQKSSSSSKPGQRKRNKKSQQQKSRKDAAMKKTGLL